MAGALPSHRAEPEVDDAEPLGFWAIAEADPDRVAIVDANGAETTFGELLRSSRAVAAGLAARGLVAGDALSIVLPNVPAFLVCYLAAMETGLYLTPVSSHLAAPEVAHVIADCEAKAVVVDVGLADLCRSGIEAAGIERDARFAHPMADGYRPLADLVAEGVGCPPPPRRSGAPMLYTSGTTGKPKGVRRPLPDLDPDTLFGKTAEVYCTGFGITPGPGVHLVCGPLYHAGPFASATNALHGGSTLVLMAKWDAEACLARIERHGVTSTQMVPTMFSRLLALPEDVKAAYDVSSVESVMHTGAPCPTQVKLDFMAWFGPVVYETYGGTESVATIATPRRWLQKPGTVGRPIHGVSVHILDDDGNELPTGQPGAIYIESAAGRQAGYFKDPEKTRQMKRGGLVTLGDVGYLDEDGFLFLQDRKVDMIISGGVNIYPAEIEAALLQSPLVVDVAVIGIPDDDWGEQVLAVVELTEGTSAGPETEQALLAHCGELISRLKHPRRFEFVGRLPRLPNGKIEKRRLREPWWAGRDRAI